MRGEGERERETAREREGGEGLVVEAAAVANNGGRNAERGLGRAVRKGIDPS